VGQLFSCRVLIWLTICSAGCPVEGNCSYVTRLSLTEGVSTHGVPSHGHVFNGGLEVLVGVGSCEAGGLVVGFVRAYHVSVQVQGGGGLHGGFVWVVPDLHGEFRGFVCGVRGAAARG